MTTNEDRLSDAFERGDLEEFSAVLKLHPERLRTEKGKDAWLYDAADLGRLDFVKFLVEAGIDVNESHDDRPDGAVLYAADEGHYEVVRWLLDKGAKINYNRAGKTWCSALVGAIVGGHFDVVKLLVQRGADVNAIGPGMTPLTYAISYDQKDIADFLRSVGAKEAWQLTSRDLQAGHRTILEHFEKHRGDKPSPLSLHDIVASSEPKIRLHVVPANADWDGQALFTVGMSDRPLKLPDGSEGFAELAIYLPTDWLLTNASLGQLEWSWPVTWLLRIARYPHETGSWPGGESLIFANGEPPRPIAPNTQLSCLLCVADPGQFGQILMPDHRHVTIYSVYPIYAEERDLEKREGTRRLLELFQQHGVPRTVAIDRVNVALQPK